MGSGRETDTSMSGLFCLLNTMARITLLVLGCVQRLSASGAFFTRLAKSTRLILLLVRGEPPKAGRGSIRNPASIILRAIARAFCRASAEPYVGRYPSA